MERSAIKDEFWDGAMVESAIAGRHVSADEVKTGDELVAVYQKRIDTLYEVADLFGNELIRQMVARAAGWYPAAGQIAQSGADRYGISRDSSAAILAALSPGHDWDSNIAEHEIALSVWKRNDVVDAKLIAPILKDIFNNQLASSKTERGTASKQKKLDELDSLLARVDGKRFNDLSLEDRSRILKAHAAVTGHDFSMSKWEVDDSGNPVNTGFRYNLDGSVKKIAFQCSRFWMLRQRAILGWTWSSPSRSERKRRFGHSSTTSTTQTTPPMT
jgi:hypothetical protein